MIPLQPHKTCVKQFAYNFKLPVDSEEDDANDSEYDECQQTTTDARIQYQLALIVYCGGL